MNRRARLAVATVIAGLGFGLVCASGASALTINGCEIKPGTQCPGADLSGADLNHAHLQGANLSGAKLGGTRLNHANLISANLSGVKAHGASFNFADLGLAAVQHSDLTGSNFYSAILGKADFTGATVVGVNFVHAHFDQTRFRGALIHGADVIPSDIDGDHWARHYFFFRVYTHVNAYGDHGDCTVGSSGSASCKGQNDDPKAQAPFSHGVSFVWGSRKDGDDRFIMRPSIDSINDNVLTGRTNTNLGDFYVDKVQGQYLPGLGPTENTMPRGHPGGPIALGINWHGGISHGYSINVSGWLPRLNHAAGWGP
jgi:uncharacterized protein YjbI with pentapeptide repeats